MICRDLKPSAHARKSANTANKVLGLMARSFHFRDRKTWIGLYKTYVRPHMEYASPYWSPWTNRDIDLLESVQERTVNICSGLRSQTYDDKLKELGLKSLADRRFQSDMVKTWKILNNKDRVKKSIWFTRLNNARNRCTGLTDSGMNLLIPRANLEIRRNFYSH